MYIPYVRGRQYDLIAIRELAQIPHIYQNESVLPIIEPVSVTGTPLASYRLLAANRTPFILISNPQHGGVSERDVRTVLIEDILDAHGDYYIGYIINERTTLANLRRFMETYEEFQFSFIHYNMPPDPAAIAGYINGLDDVAHNVFLNDNLTKAYVRSIRSRDSKKITLKDGFNKAANNAAYAGIPQEHFHDLHLTFRGDGYDGFGDFCTIGEHFDTGGFTPLAVAIHLTHREPAAVVTRHFVSDDMEDRSDTSGKYGQAVRKLDAFIGVTPTFPRTRASDVFQMHHATGTYPGLPSVKKLSIMHHVEMMRGLI